MSDSFSHLVSQRLGVPEETVAAVVEESLAEIHRRCLLHRCADGDWIGELLPFILTSRGYFHLVGLFDLFATYFGWEAGDQVEYFGRLGPEEVWNPFVEEERNWLKSEEAQGRRPRR